MEDIYDDNNKTMIHGNNTNDEEILDSVESSSEKKENENDLLEMKNIENETPLIHVGRWPGREKECTVSALALANLGNTCYLNSVFQALAHCPTIYQYFAQCWPNATPHAFAEPNQNRSEFIQSFAHMILYMWKEDIQNRINRHFIPRAVVRNIIRAVPEFHEFGQHDAQEALNYTLNFLHEELSIATPPTNHPARMLITKLDKEQKEMNRRVKSGELSSPSLAPPQSPRTPVSPNAKSISNKTDDESDKQNKKRGSLRLGLKRNSSKSSSIKNMGKPDPIECPKTKDSKTSSVSKPLEQVEPTTNKDDESLSSDPCFLQLVNPYHQSIISDTFQNLLVQRVQCQCCEYESLCVEETMELALALPSKAHLREIEKQSLSRAASTESLEAVAEPDSSSEDSSKTFSFGNVFKGFAKNMMNTFGIESHQLSLMNCLNEFFMPEKLQGEERYYCESCKCKQDGVKSHFFGYLPDILCLTLKRFNKYSQSNWSLTSSSKNSTAVEYPVTGLDLAEFVYDKEVASCGSTYDLIAVVRHSGNVHGGHYIAFCKNPGTGKWYEYDDDYCTPIDESQVVRNDAYLLFYEKVKTTKQLTQRGAVYEANRTAAVALSSGQVQYEHFVSQYWSIKLDALCNPQMISSFDITCPHGKVQPQLGDEVPDRVFGVSNVVWDRIVKTYGVQEPILSCIEECNICSEEASKLSERRTKEKDDVHEIQANDGDENGDDNNSYLINERWVVAWQKFVRNTPPVSGRGTFMGACPPEKIDNACLLNAAGGVKTGLKEGREYRVISHTLWKYFMDHYGGGPEIPKSIVT